MVLHGRQAPSEAGRPRATIIATMHRLSILSLLIFAARASAFQPGAQVSATRAHVCAVPPQISHLPPKRTSEQPLLQQQQALNQIAATRSSHRRDALISLASTTNDGSETPNSGDDDASPIAALAFAAIAVAYWYLLVFGAAAASAGLPVPDFIPLIPGWPPSDADLAPALEDSAHFFYIKDLLEGRDASVPPVRLAVFNFAEAWIFAFLPALLADAKRLPLPAVIFAWAGGLGLTNAFLAPYLFFREAFALGNNDGVDGDDNSTPKGGRNALFSFAVGGIATAVVAYAGYDCLTASTGADWGEFAQLAKNDRTYLAFLVDLGLFSASQSFLLGRLYYQQNGGEEGPKPQIYNVPFVGLMAWLFGI